VAPLSDPRDPDVLHATTEHVRGGGKVVRWAGDPVAGASGGQL